MSVVLKPQTEQDIMMLLPLARATHEDSSYADLEFSDVCAVATGLQTLQNDQWFMRYMRNDKEPYAMLIGFVTPHFFSQQSYVQDLLFYIKPAYRGGPVAVRLLKTFIAWANTTHAIEMRLGITEGITNETAIRLYERYGFEQAGRFYRRRLAA